VVVVCEMADEVNVRLQGEAGYLESAVLDSALMPLRARRTALVTFDLSELTFIASLALGILVSFYRSAKQYGGRVRLTAMQPNVREAIERTGLIRLFQESDAAAGAQDAGPNPASVKP
jgi:anti-anti-sigma factor